ncbi:MAG: response regulator transcription factor [bacterium]|nr:response regulator transcription factor [bacterium]
MTSHTRVVIQNPYALEREGMAALLRSADGVEVVGTSADCDGTAALVGEGAVPAVVLVDLQSDGDGDGLGDVRRLHGLGTPPRVVVLRRDYVREQVLAAFEAGASACVSTSADLADLLTAVQAAETGRTYCCPIVARSLIEAQKPPSDVPTPGLRPLTPRELEVLERIARGQTDRQIATTLGLAVGTVHTHRKHIMAKLGVHNVAGLLRRARALGLLRG